MPNIGPMELVVVALIALLVLGPKRLPEAARSLGAGIREFKDGVTGKSDEPAPAALVESVHAKAAGADRP